MGASLAWPPSGANEGLESWRAELTGADHGRNLPNAAWRSIGAGSGPDMKVFHGTDDFPREMRGAALAIGNFDGVHRGHQALIARARERADASARLGTKRPAGAILEPPGRGSRP